MTTRFLLLLLYELLKIEIEAKSTYHHVCRETKVCLGASSDFHTCIRRRNGEKKNEKQEMKLHIFVALAMVMFTLKKSKHIIRKL